MFDEEPMVINGETTFTLNQAAKLLNFEIGRTRLMKLLREWELLLNNNEPSQSMIARKYMLYLLKPILRKGKPFKVPVTVVTIEGLAYLKRLINVKLKKKKNDRSAREANLCNDGRGSAGPEN